MENRMERYFYTGVYDAETNGYGMWGTATINNETNEIVGFEPDEEEDYQFGW
jgi:hypothetical protein